MSKFGDSRITESLISATTYVITYFMNMVIKVASKKCPYSLAGDLVSVMEFQRVISKQDNVLDQSSLQANKHVIEYSASIFKKTLHEKQCYYIFCVNLELEFLDCGIETESANQTSYLLSIQNMVPVFYNISNPILGQFCCLVVQMLLHIFEIRILLSTDKKSLLCPNSLNIIENQNNGKVTLQKPVIQVKLGLRKFCIQTEDDEVIRIKLYNDFCDDLYKLQLNIDIYNWMEFDVLKETYQNDLNDVLEVVHAQPENENVLSIPEFLAEPCRKRMFTQGDFDYEKKVFITGEDFGKLYKTNYLCRYQKEFEEEVFIAGGGFGKVYKARHCLDEKEYAIKKITVERITEWQLNEVRTLATLNHPNIVPYHTAWIESSSLYTSNASSTNSISSCSSKCYRRDSKFSSPLAIKDSFNNEYDLNLNKTKIHHNKTDILFDTNAFCKTDTNIKMKKSNKVHKNDDNNINSNTISVTFEDSSANIIDEKIVEKNTIKEYYTAESSSNVVFFQNGKINDRCEKLDLTNNIEKKVEENTTKESSLNGVSFRNSKSNESPDQAIVNASTSSSCEESSREVNIYTSNKNTSYTLYIQMALCEQTLEQWLRDKMSVTPESIVKAIFQQIVCGVDYIHSQKIVHHDIKPSNIFMTTSGLRVQLGDFGLACPLQKKRHSVIGTHIYTTPEQMQGKCDPKSDIYSIGVVFIELAISIKTRMELTNIIKSLRSGEVLETLKQRGHK